MPKLMLDFVRYFLTYKNNLISSAFKAVFFFFRGALPPARPTWAAPMDPLPHTASAPGSNYLIHDL